MPSILDSLVPEHSFLIRILNDYSKDILLETIHEKVLDYTLVQEAEYALDYLVKGLVADEIMPMLYDIYIEDSYDTILLEIIKEFVYEECPAICKSFKTKLFVSRPSKAKSIVIDEQMNKIMDQLICEELLLSICGLGSPLSDQIAREVDLALLQNLVLQL